MLVICFFFFFFFFFFPPKNILLALDYLRRLKSPFKLSPAFPDVKSPPQIGDGLVQFIFGHNNSLPLRRQGRSLFRPPDDFPDLGAKPLPLNVAVFFSWIMHCLICS